MNILLVDDDDVDAMLFCRAMKCTQDESCVVHGKDGVEALEILRKQHSNKQLQEPYVIVLDINMPRMNGHEFLSELRSDEKLGASRVVVMTTSQDPKDINRAYVLGASGYVVKPTGTVAMKSIVNSLHGFWEICEDQVSEPLRPLN